MSTQAATCKFCQKPLLIQVDPEYTEDCFNLLRLAACNRCADYESGRRKLFRRVKALAELLIQRAVAREDLPKVRESMEVLMKQFMRLYGEHHDLDLPVFEQGIVDALMDKPTHYGLVLGAVPRMFEQRRLV